MIRLELHHKPMSKPRPRASRNGHVYMPRDYEIWREAIAIDAQAQYRGEPLTGPLRVFLEVIGPSRGRYDLEGVFGAIMDTIGGDRRTRPGICFEDDSQIQWLEAKLSPGPDWLIEVLICPIAERDWKGAAKVAKMPHGLD